MVGRVRNKVLLDSSDSDTLPPLSAVTLRCDPRLGRPGSGNLNTLAHLKDTAGRSRTDRDAVDLKRTWKASTTGPVPVLVMAAVKVMV